MTQDLNCPAMDKFIVNCEFALNAKRNKKTVL